MLNEQSDLQTLATRWSAGQIAAAMRRFAEDRLGMTGKRNGARDRTAVHVRSGRRVREYIVAVNLVFGPIGLGICFY